MEAQQQRRVPTKRAVIKGDALMILENAFRAGTTWSTFKTSGSLQGVLSLEHAEEMGLSEKRVAKWFDNRQTSHSKRTQHISICLVCADRVQRNPGSIHDVVTTAPNRICASSARKFSSKPSAPAAAAAAAVAVAVAVAAAVAAAAASAAAASAAAAGRPRRRKLNEVIADGPANLRPSKVVAWVAPAPAELRQQQQREQREGEGEGDGDNGGRSQGGTPGKDAPLASISIADSDGEEQYNEVAQGRARAAGGPLSGSHEQVRLASTDAVLRMSQGQYACWLEGCVGRAPQDRGAR